jgi:hypothetical protein
MVRMSRSTVRVVAARVVGARRDLALDPKPDRDVIPADEAGARSTGRTMATDRVSR